MRDALMLQLEKFSYYQHLSLTGGQERRISACRVFEIRGTRYHVLSHIQDAGLDFTGRTNFLAHHLVFTPEEIRQFASPPIILARWSGWLNSWSKEPEQLENEDWGNLSELSSAVSVPAQNWQALSGEAANGYGMLETRSGSSFRVDNVSEEQILALFAESLELLELRDPRRDFRVSAWQYTFTTSMQEQDNPADFRWRCLHSDNPASSRFAGPDCRALTDVRLVRVTNEERSFAQNGRQAPRIVVQPHDVRLKEGEATQLSVKAEGVPVPSYQWYSVDKSGAGQIISNATGPELPLPNPPFGVSRYVVQVVNSVGEVTSELAKVECEKKLKLTSSSSSQAAVTQQAGASSYDPDYEAKRDNQRRRLQQEEENRENKNRRIWNKFTMAFGLVVLVVLVAIGYLVLHKNKAGGGADNLDATQTNGKSPVSLAAQSPPSPTASNSEPAMTKNTLKSDEPAPKTTSQKVLPLDMNQMPPGWIEMPIGEMDLHATDPFKPPYQFELKSSASGFQPKQDSVYYVCTTNLNQGFETQITFGPTNGLNGIMLRDSGEKGSRFLFIGATSQQIYLYRRDSKGEYDHTNYAYSKLNSNISFRFSLEVKDGKWIPNYSVDSVNWIPFKQFEFSTESNALVGFAQAYGINNLPAKAKFRQVPITR
jgi:hypothetical protein